MDERIAFWATRALENVSHSDVRALALDFLRTRHLAARGTRLLRANYREGDLQLIEEALLHAESDDQFHNIEFDALAACKAHPVPANERILTLLYERGPCSRCRSRAIEFLAAIGPLPEWMIEKCRFDVEDDTRAFIAERYPDGDILSLP